MKFYLLFIFSTCSLFPLQIQIRDKYLDVEIADTEKLRQQGLQHRRKLATSKGMLFIFPKSNYATFWMKNTYIDLSIGFFDENRKLVQVEKMPAFQLNQQLSLYKSIKPIKYALEANMGWFEKNDIKLGDEINLIK